MSFRGRDARVPKKDHFLRIMNILEYMFDQDNVTRLYRLFAILASSLPILRAHL